MSTVGQKLGQDIDDMAIGTIILVGDYRWRKGPRLMAALAFVLGRRQRIEHLGMHCTLAWFCGHPYLIRMRGDV